jgi:UDP-N-acetylglucosamine 1-carboxyvinyltransferase
MLGALLARFGRAKIYYPGGCNIGSRPINIHLNALKKLGVSVNEYDDGIYCSASKLVGKEIYLDFPSVGATINAMLCAVKAKGKTEIQNCAKEPEIVDLQRFLNSMGAKVYGAGTSNILVEGVNSLHGTDYTPISDRIECGTFLVATAVSGGEIEIVGVNAKNISPLIHKLCDNTCKITIKNDIIYLKSGEIRKTFSFSTGPYPYFPTDLQAQTSVLLAVSDGVGVVTENIFENRYKYVQELNRMGAKIKVEGRSAVIKGTKRIQGANVVATDLRGGAALILEALVAKGVTEIENINYILRGYEKIEEKLKKLGVKIYKM